MVLKMKHSCEPPGNRCVRECGVFERNMLYTLIMEIKKSYFLNQKVPGDKQWQLNLQHIGGVISLLQREFY